MSDTSRAIDAILATIESEFDCTKCGNSGWVNVSYANPENGPTDDPADEQGTEPCECPHGTIALLEYNEENDRMNKLFFAALETPVDQRTPEQVALVAQADESFENAGD